MNDEKTSTEAEQKKPGDMTDSIERMKAVLDAVEHEVREARFLVTGMESCPLKWTTLSRACDRIHDLTCWEFYMKNPEVFRTSKEVIDFVTANPPLGEVKDAPTPLDPNAPPIAQGEEPWRKIDDTESVGVRYSGNVILAWVVHERTSVTVRAVRIYADGKPSNCWNIVASVDCEKAVIATVFGGRNRAEEVCKKIRNALIGARLRRSHYRMNVQARKAKAAEEVSND